MIIAITLIMLTFEINIIDILIHISHLLLSDLLLKFWSFSSCCSFTI